MGVETSNEKMNYSDNDISDEKINELNIKIYPNPATDKIYIDHIENNELKINVFNLTGEKIISEQTVKQANAPVKPALKTGQAQTTASPTTINTLALAKETIANIVSNKYILLDSI